MFYHIEGTVTELEPGLIVLDCGGVGYALNATLNTVGCIHMGDKVKLYVAESIGENNFDLFGFYTKSEKRCFDMLVSVSGIGPKAALSILPLEHFSMAAPDQQEADIRRLWKRFYDTVAIRERYNPRCRRTHMPQRYWATMTEFQGPEHFTARSSPAAVSGPGAPAGISAPGTRPESVPSGPGSAP